MPYAATAIPTARQHMRPVLGIAIATTRASKLTLAPSVRRLTTPCRCTIMRNVSLGERRIVSG